MKSLTAAPAARGIERVGSSPPGLGAGGRAGRGRLACAIFLRRAAISLPDPQPPCAAGARRRARVAHRFAARRGGDARRREASRRAPRLHHLPLGAMPVGQPGEDARPAGRQPRRRGGSGRGRRAQLPPSPGAVDGRLPGAGRARAVAAGGHAQGARSPRPRRARVQRAARRACTSSRRFTPKRASPARAGGFPNSAGWR